MGLTTLSFGEYVTAISAPMILCCLIAALATELTLYQWVDIQECDLDNTLPECADLFVRERIKNYGPDGGFNMSLIPTSNTSSTVSRALNVLLGLVGYDKPEIARHHAGRHAELAHSYIGAMALSGNSSNTSNMSNVSNVSTWNVSKSNIEALLVALKSSLTSSDDDDDFFGAGSEEAQLADPALE